MDCNVIAIALLNQSSHSALTDRLATMAVHTVGVEPPTLYWPEFQFHCLTPVHTLL